MAKFLKISYKLSLFIGTFLNSGIFRNLFPFFSSQIHLFPFLFLTIPVHSFATVNDRP